MNTPTITLRSLAIASGITYALFILPIQVAGYIYQLLGGIVL